MGRWIRTSEATATTTGKIESTFFHAQKQTIAINADADADADADVRLAEKILFALLNHKSIKRRQIFVESGTKTLAQWLGYHPLTL